MNLEKNGNNLSTLATFVNLNTLKECSTIGKAHVSILCQLLMAQDLSLLKSSPAPHNLVTLNCQPSYVTSDGCESENSLASLVI